MCIRDRQFTRTPQGLYAPVTYVLSMGGKRIRPVLMLMAYNPVSYTHLKDTVFLKYLVTFALQKLTKAFEELKK